MELLNATKMIAGYTLGIDKTGRESVVVVVKGTFTLPTDGSEPQLVDDQRPLVEADEASGEPGFSATLYESDYAPFKPRCDVLLNGSACAPNGLPVRSLDVGLKVSSIAKTMRVTGDRTWTVVDGKIRARKPQPFLKRRINYDVAFGGLDDFHPDEDKRDAYMANPIGRGYHTNLDEDLVIGTPLPNTEERGRPVVSPTEIYRPMAFGPIGRGIPQRARYAGTYDQHWVDNVFPFLPDDFDDRYYQAAPEDQQCDYLVGGEVVQLVNLTSAGSTFFRIPEVDVPVVYFRNRDEDVHCTGVLDTLLIEPDEGVFSLVWRTNLQLKRDLFEISAVLVGKKSRGWWVARESGVSYYSALEDVAEDE